MLFVLLVTVVFLLTSLGVSMAIAGRSHGCGKLATLSRGHFSGAASFANPSACRWVHSGLWMGKSTTSHCCVSCVVVLLRRWHQSRKYGTKRQCRHCQWVFRGTGIGLDGTLG